MWFTNLLNIIANFPLLILHVVSQNSFPKPLSRQEELEYINMLKNGSQYARDKLVNHNLRLVAHISKKYHNTNDISDDLISIGTIGLIKAVNTFNSDKGVRLSSYAARCIENEILMYFRSANKSSLDISIDEPIETDKNGNILTLIDTIACNNSIEDEIDKKIEIQNLNNKIIKLLSPRERIIIYLRYGLNGTKPLTQREVAKKLKISRSYVSRLEKKSLNKLKESLIEINANRRCLLNPIYKDK